MSSTYEKALHSLGRSVKRFIPDEQKHRKVLFGVCKGNYLPMNLHRNIRVLLGIYETEIAGYVRRYARSSSCSYDIGANNGYYTLALARLGTSAQIYAFEANPALCAGLKETLALNGEVEKRIKIINAFLSDRVDQS